MTRFGTISLRGVLYTVPSRLIGSRLKVHLFDDRIVCHLGATPVLTLPRRYRRAGDKAVRQIDYRHLIGSLVKKPQAFRHSVFREQLFPREAYRRAWEALDAGLEPRKACRVYVGLLHLAAMNGCEEALARHLEAVLDEGSCPIWRSPAPRSHRCRPPCRASPFRPPNLTAYDGLLADPILARSS